MLNNKRKKKAKTENSRKTTRLDKVNHLYFFPSKFLADVNDGADPSLPTKKDVHRQHVCSFCRARPSFRKSFGLEAHLLEAHDLSLSDLQEEWRARETGRKSSVRKFVRKIEGELSSSSDEGDSDWEEGGEVYRPVQRTKSGRSSTRRPSIVVDASSDDEEELYPEAITVTQSVLTWMTDQANNPEVFCYRNLNRELREHRVRLNGGLDVDSALQELKEELQDRKRADIKEMSDAGKDEGTMDEYEGRLEVKSEDIVEKEIKAEHSTNDIYLEQMEDESRSPMSEEGTFTPSNNPSDCSDSEKEMSEAEPANVNGEQGEKSIRTLSEEHKNVMRMAEQEVVQEMLRDKTGQGGRANSQEEPERASSVAMELNGAEEAEDACQIIYLEDEGKGPGSPILEETDSSGEEVVMLDDEEPSVGSSVEVIDLSDGNDDEPHNEMPVEITPCKLN